jgi:hypothetical protein
MIAEAVLTVRLSRNPFRPANEKSPGALLNVPVLCLNRWEKGDKASPGETANVPRRNSMLKLKKFSVLREFRSTACAAGVRR